ncbi:MAG TPA: nitric-oxide reductase large subunit [Polyangia bacterium]|nr:nitric-oxide reductase large subunit [Polyangia bacterium]
MRYRKHWIGLAIVVVASFVVLGGQGVKLVRQLPPIPGQVVDAATGQPLFDAATIRRGQNVWQSIGGQEVGSIWGHGAYVAPDWTADWLHRESVAILDGWARAGGASSFDAAPAETRAALQVRLTGMMRPNGYDQARDEVRLPPERIAAFHQNAAHYADVFSKGRDAYAIPRGALKDPTRLRELAAFFWWTSWVATTNRPGDTVSYTSNWPHEPLVQNVPTSGMTLWSLASVILLLAAIAGLVWHRAAQPEEAAPSPPPLDPFRSAPLTPSQRATMKYFLVVAALFLAQVGLGGVTAHYGVEGQSFYGIPLAEWLPYAVTRSWHTQLGIFWIATAWLGTGLFLAPSIGGEPRFQRLGVNVLFGALLVIVVGALAGQWLSVQQRLGGQLWYWFGHQGYEYVDLGRFWQIFLFAGLFIWLALMGRALWPALRRRDEQRPLLVLFVLSSAAIALFYGAGLMYGRQSHLASVEYWRWWVVHLWVEGFFEVFATVAIAFLFVRMGVLRTSAATPAVLFATAVFLAGGIVGTLHHLYFTGTPSSALSLGAVFSALEVAPLTLIGYDVWQNLRAVRRSSGAPEWMARYRWPIYFFVAVAFWNLLGAGVFGFLINPPISLYYVQGLNLTPVHGHTALFGVYGMLGIGLALFALRVLSRRAEWREGVLKFAFWSLNAGLLVMVALSLLPIGLLQAQAAIERGTWYARSAEFLQSPLLANLRWLRVPGDVIFSAGVVALAWFIIGLKTGWSYRTQVPASEQAAAGNVPAAL